MAGENNELLPADPGYAYGDVLPLRRRLGANGLAVGPVELALPNMARGAINDLAATITGPGLAAQGQLSPDQINALAPRMAGTMMRLGLGASPILEPVAGDFLGSFKGWHGTPHVFEPVEHNPFGEFRDSAIGSGEGAQVYGHGHYVAGARQTAETYQRSLSQPQLLFNGEPMDMGSARWPEYVHQAVANIVDEKNGNFDNVIANLERTAQKYPEHADLKDAANWIKQNKNKLEYKENPGSLLHLEIKPEEHELLDWDQQLAQQHPQVQEAVRPLLMQQLERQWNALQSRRTTKPELVPLQNANFEDLPEIANSFTGQEIYKRIGLPAFDTAEGQQKASKALAEAGVPGIKYLDAFSRPIQQRGAPPVVPKAPTHNYVIFDPKNIEIKGRE